MKCTVSKEQALQTFGRVRFLIKQVNSYGFIKLLDLDCKSLRMPFRRTLSLNGYILSLNHHMMYLSQKHTLEPI